MEKPSVELKIVIQETNFTVKYPNSGQWIEIAILKSKLSDNQYQNLLFQHTRESGLVVKLIDAYSFLSIMLPDLKKHLTKSLYDLELEESIELVHAYDNTITPWLDQWTDLINKRINELKEDKQDNSKRNLV